MSRRDCIIFLTLVAVDMSTYLSPTSTTIPPMIVPSVCREGMVKWEGGGRRVSGRGMVKWEGSWKEEGDGEVEGKWGR